MRSAHPPSRPVQSRGRRALPAAIGLTLLLLHPAAGATPAQPPHIAGSLNPNATLFVVPDLREGGTFALYRLTPGPDRELETVIVPGLTGNPTHAAAIDNTLWVLTPDRQVRAIALKPLPGPIPRSRVTVRPFPDLPLGTIPRALALHNGQPYVLARIESQATLQLLHDTAATADGTPATAPAKDRLAQLKRNIALGLPLDYTPPTPPTLPIPTTAAQTQPATQPDAPPATQPTPPAPQSTTADRLLVLRPDGWHPVPLPTEWDHPKGLVQLLPRPSHTHPTILLQRDAGWTIHEHASNAWSARTVRLPDDTAAPADNWSARLIDGQTVLAWQTTAPQPDAGATVSLGVARQDRVNPLGKITVTEPAWALAATPEAATILTYRTPKITDDTAEPDQHFLIIQTLRLDDAAVGEPLRIAPRTDAPALQSVGFIILVVIMVSVAAMLALFWKRPADQQQPQLPDALAVADLFRRALAGSIDLAPGFLLASLLFDTDLSSIVAFWPGNTSVGHWEAIRPGVLVVALTVLHTTAAETFTQRSLGKALLGLRVADLHGHAPTRIALLHRGLLKPFDLIAWLLLVVPIISPHRQRLADLMSKTVVVTPKPEPDEDAPTSDA